MDERRRHLLAAAGAAASGIFLSRSAAAQALAVSGTEHWVTKRVDGQPLRLFAWRKRTLNAPKGALLFVHGASAQSTPSFDLQVAGRPEHSAMDWFARLGYDTWTFDCEGYGRSDKSRPIGADVATGANDIVAVADYIAGRTGSSRLSLYGAGAGAQRVALYAQRSPLRIARIALDAFAWTGEASPALAERRAALAQFKAANRRAVARELLRERRMREHGDAAAAGAFADAVLALDDSLPTGAEIDMAEKLPLVDPAQMKVPTLVLRGQLDGSAAFPDVLEFFSRLGHAERQMAVLPAAGASLHSRSWQAAYHLLDSFFSGPPPAQSG